MILQDCTTKRGGNLISEDPAYTTVKVREPESVTDTCDVECLDTEQTREPVLKGLVRSTKTEQ